MKKNPQKLKSITKITGNEKKKKKKIGKRLYKHGFRNPLRFLKQYSLWFPLFSFYFLLYTVSLLVSRKTRRYRKFLPVNNREFPE